MKKSMMILFAGIMILQACKKDKKPTVTNPPNNNEEELITTLRMDFIAGGDSTSVYFRDIDGPGGNAPSEHDTIRLVDGVPYEVKIYLLNESTSPVEDITTEVAEEGDEHLFCFEPVGVNLSIVATDTDGTHPIGLESAWIAGASGSGTTTVRLRHQPGVKDGTCAPGDTDIEVTFVTEIMP